jgi:aspartate carbamoyltransferase catalytic subunit
VRDFIRIDDVTREEIESIFHLAHDMEVMREMGSDLCKGRILGTLFFEPSTRTRLSFESAMCRLGGSVLGFSDPAATSFAKDETLADTIQMVCNYADILVIRHFWAGSANVASQQSRVPIINAGDDGNQHPTQTLTDLYTLWKTGRDISSMTVGVCGDLRFGRAAHSLVYGLATFGVNIVLIAPPGLDLPPEEAWRLEHEYNASVTLVEEPGDVIGDLDVLYVNRLQKERLPKDLDPVEVQRIASRYRIDAELIKRAKPDCMVLHPLPRVDELARELDSDPRAAYFEQSSNGVPVRMALMAMLMGRVDRPTFSGRPRDTDDHADRVCHADTCVTNHEPRLTARTEAVGGPSSRRACNYCGRFVNVT